MDIQQMANDGWRAAASAAAYVLSACLVAGDWLHWLNSNAAACGVVLGLLTYCTNLFFQIRNSRIISKQHIERRKGGE
ncbi:MAG: hypothetical protein ABSB19_17305 [Methylomonas sp.]|jgi:hypothetical protein